MSLLNHCSRADKDVLWKKDILIVEEMVEGLLTKEAFEKPSDTEDPDKLDIQLPEWFDEKEFNKGRRFYRDNCFSLSTSMLVSLIAVFAVPSILRVLVCSRRSSSTYTAYRRYLSTNLHTISWFEHELKPGSVSWRSLLAVRRRHYRAGLAAKAHGDSTVSQRDVALTQFGFFGFSMLKPDKFGIRQWQEGGWEGYNHFWRVIGYMLGLEDRYNICRNTVEETRQVCQHLLERVYTPCLENVPEYFEHMARVMLDGMSCIMPTLDINAALYFCKLLGDVPGYVYTEGERIAFQRKLREKLKGKTIDTGVDVSGLMAKPAMDDLPDLPTRHLYLRDFETMETVPAYKKLTFTEKLNLSFSILVTHLYSTYLGHLYFNLQHRWAIFLSQYFPYLGFIRFGIKNAYVDIFEEDLKDDTKPKKNVEYYNAKPVPWYRAWLSLLW